MWSVNMSLPFRPFSRQRRGLRLNWKMASSSDASVLRRMKQPSSSAPVAPARGMLSRATTLAEIPETVASSQHHAAATNGGSRVCIARTHPVAQSAPLRRSKSDDCLDEAHVTVSECPICFDGFGDDDASSVPRNLSCGHTYCTGCLQRLVLSIKLPSQEIPCPKCAHPTVISAGNVDALPRNYALLEVLRSSRTVSPRSSTSPVPDRLEPSGPAHLLSPGGGHYCPEHGDHLSSYCTNDGQLICSTCLYYGSAHKNHRTLLVKDAASENRQKLLQFSPEVLEQKRRMERALSEVNGVLEEVQAVGFRLSDEVDGQFEALVQLITERRRRARLDIMERTQLRAHALLKQARELRESVQQADSVCQISEQLLTSDDFTLLTEALVTTEQIEGVFINPPSTQPRAHADLTCEFSSDISTELDSLLEGFVNLRSSVGTIEQVALEAYHDGIRISWAPHNFVDNQGISYHLQMATSHADSEFTYMYRGGNTKFTWKPAQQLEEDLSYRFRVQVRTTEGVGHWSAVQEVCRAPPAFRWHSKWRNVKVALSPDKLQAMWCGGGTHKYWATFAGDCFFTPPGQHYVELEVISLGKHRSTAKKLAIGVVNCGRGQAGGLPWHDGKFPVGQWRDVQSWSFHPLSGVLNSNSLPVEGRPYSEVGLQEGDRIGMLVDMDEGKLSYFCNGQDLGVAFESEEVGVDSLLPAVSIRDKICVRLRFPPPPYPNRTVRLIKLNSRAYSSGSLTL